MKYCIRENPFTTLHTARFFNGWICLKTGKVSQLYKVSNMWFSFYKKSPMSHPWVLKFSKRPKANSKFWAIRKVTRSSILTTQKYFSTTRPHSVTRATRRPWCVHLWLGLWYRVRDTKHRRNGQGFLSHFVKTPKSPTSK